MRGGAGLHISDLTGRHAYIPCGLCIHNDKRAGHAPYSPVFNASVAPADLVGGVMTNTRCWILLGLASTFAVPALAQSFRVQCPESTITHPVSSAQGSTLPANNNSEPAYSSPTTLSLVPAMATTGG